MINFRFHLVSLIAVFLALTVGIVMGATVIDRAIVDGLNDRIDSVSRKADERRKESELLAGEVSRLNEFIGASQPYVVDDRLTDVPLVVLATRGVDTNAVDAQVDVLRQAGATVPAVVWLEDRWALDDDDSVKALADAIGSTDRTPATLREAAWRALARRLADGRSEPAVPDAGSTVDPLTALVDAGFVKVERVGSAEVDLGTFPGPGAHAALITGSGFAPGNLVRASASALTDASVPTVVGAVLGSSTPVAQRADVLSPFFADGAPAGVSTVDDVDIPQGRMALALASSDLGREPPVVGHYGYGDGATAPLPPFKAG